MRRVLALVGAFFLLLLVLISSTASARVLRVGTYHGIRGQFRTIQGAVRAAKPGDWILVAPGDYKTWTSRSPQGRPDLVTAILITKHNLHIRGMSRNKVIVDGTRPHSGRCSSKPGAQNFGPSFSGGQSGLNGILVWKADNVSIENLTACNFLTGTGTAGNQIWWNGGDDSGQIGGWGFNGSYLTATSTYYRSESTAAAYGIFSSNWSGGTWNRDYTSNFNDSGFYIGGCQQQCDQTVNHVWTEYNALGYSGTNSGGTLIVKNSQFDNNEDGFSTNSQNNSDWPSPQDGACPNNGTSPITHTHSCWVFMDNYVHDNNDPDVPSSGAAAAGPVGTGASVSGSRDDTLMHNRFVNNKAWGAIFVPYPDTETPPSNFNPSCTGGISGPGNVCNYDDWGNALIDNTFTTNGGYGNQTNGDFAEITTTSPHPINCYVGNVDTAGPLTSSPSNLQQTNGNCGQTALTPDPNPTFTNQLACDSQFFVTLLPTSSEPCPPGASYPQRTAIIMHALPKHLRSMPHPCKGVPRNPWCPAGSGHKKHH